MLKPSRAVHVAEVADQRPAIGQQVADALAGHHGGASAGVGQHRDVGVAADVASVQAAQDRALGKAQQQAIGEAVVVDRVLRRAAFVEVTIVRSTAVLDAEATGVTHQLSGFELAVRRHIASADGAALGVGPGADSQRAVRGAAQSALVTRVDMAGARRAGGGDLGASGDAAGHGRACVHRAAAATRAGPGGHGLGTGAQTQAQREQAGRGD